MCILQISEKNTIKDEKTGKSYLVSYYHIGTIGEHNLGLAYVDKILDLYGIPSNSQRCVIII